MECIRCSVLGSRGDLRVRCFRYDTKVCTSLLHGDKQCRITQCKFICNYSSYFTGDMPPFMSCLTQFACPRAVFLWHSHCGCLRNSRNPLRVCVCVCVCVFTVFLQPVIFSKKIIKLSGMSDLTGYRYIRHWYLRCVWYRLPVGIWLGPPFSCDLLSLCWQVLSFALVVQVVIEPGTFVFVGQYVGLCLSSVFFPRKVVILMPVFLVIAWRKCEKHSKIVSSGTPMSWSQCLSNRIY
jgi:hypothetical protein